MSLDWWTIGLQTINFVVLVWLLRRFLYQPVLRLVDARRSAIQRETDEAKSARDQALSERAAIAADRAGLEAERERILKSAAAQAQEAIERRRAHAQQEAQALLEDARHSLAVERDHALAEVQGIAADLGADFARRLLAEMPPQALAGAWLERIEQRLQSLSTAERGDLERQLADGSALSVVTAVPLGADTAEVWRARLRSALDPGITITFKVNPDLIAGAELHFPTIVLSFSWQRVLPALRTEGSRHAESR